MLVGMEEVKRKARHGGCIENPYPFT